MLKPTTERPRLLRAPFILQKTVKEIDEALGGASESKEVEVRTGRSAVIGKKFVSARNLKVSNLIHRDEKIAEIVFKPSFLYGPFYERLVFRAFKGSRPEKLILNEDVEKIYDLIEPMFSLFEFIFQKKIDYKIGKLYVTVFVIDVCMEMNQIGRFLRVYGGFSYFNMTNGTMYVKELVEEKEEDDPEDPMIDEYQQSLIDRFLK